MIQLNTLTDIPHKSGLYIALVTSLVEQTDAEKIAQKMSSNLDLMKDDVIKFGNALSDVLATNAFRDADADISYEGTSITFSLRTYVGHWISITFNTDGNHEFFLSLNNNDVDLYGLNVDTLIAALKNYNQVKVVTADDIQLTNFYISPTPAPEQQRENE